MQKRIVLCADDYGQAQDISLGIVELVQLGRLSAVSCMVNSADWQEHAKWLAPYQNQINVGMHFNLTEGTPESAEYIAKYGDKFFSLPRLLSKCWFRRLDKNIILAELLAQLNRFISATNTYPDFIDGHQHIHQFPIIRDCLIEVCKEIQKNSKKNFYVRLVKHKDLWHHLNIKYLVVYFAGTKALETELNKNHIPHNSTFAGFYNFDPQSNYRAHFVRFLNSVDDMGLIMCHPGHESDNASDPIVLSRVNEFKYFGSDEFLQDCKAQKITLVPFT